jgi:hypothetical protein
MVLALKLIRSRKEKLLNPLKTPPPILEEENYQAPNLFDYSLKFTA